MSIRAPASAPWTLCRRPESRVDESSGVSDEYEEGDETEDDA